MNSIGLYSSNFIQANGLRFHYITQGQGELILMLHGFPEFCYSWRHQIAEFSQDYQVVAPDLRGYNLTDKPEELNAYSIKELVKDVRELILALGFEKCILVGHDWGGAIAWSFAYAYPEMLHKLIVLNIPHPAKFKTGITNPEQLMKSWYIFFFQLPWLPETMIAWDNYKLVADLFRSQGCFTETDIEAYVQAIAQPGALTAMLNYYRHFAQSNLFSPNTYSSVLTVPTLMIWGENDQALGKELTYGTQELVNDFTIKYIPNCSHWVQNEQPQLVNNYIQEFLTI